MELLYKIQEKAKEIIDKFWLETSFAITWILTNVLDIDSDD